MPDAFAELGVTPLYDLDDTALAAARDQATASGSAGALAAYETLANPRSRAEALLLHLGGPKPADYVGLPSGFSDVLAELKTQFAQNDPAAADRARALRNEHLNNLAHLFKQLAGFDKAPVQIGRQRMARAELNALDALEPLINGTSS